MIEVRCSCGEVYHAEDSHLGKSLRCWKCGTILNVERPRPLVPAPPSSPPVIYPPPSPVDYSPAKARSGIRRAAQRLRERWQGFDLDRRVVALLAVLVVVVVTLAIVSWMGNPDTDSPRGNRGQSAVPLVKASPSSSQGIPSAPVQIQIPAAPPCAEGRQPQRPYTGARIKPDEGTSGFCGLKISNGTDGDAAIRLLWSGTGRTARFAYIRSGETYAFTTLEPGSYELRWDTGHEWISECLMFLQDNSYSTFGRPLKFSIESNAEAQTMGCDGHKLTLYAVPGGNIDKVRISREKFLEGLAVQR